MPTSKRYLPALRRWIAAIAASAVAFAIGATLGYRVGRAIPREPLTRARLGVSVPEGAAELHAVLRSPDAPGRIGKLASLLDGLGPEALDDVRAAYDGVVLDLGEVELVLFAEWWAGFDPPAALAWARDSRIGWHPAVLQAVTRAWARRQPRQAARAVASTVQDPRLLTAALIGLARGWEESGAGGLERFLRRFPVENESYQTTIEAWVRAKVLRLGPAAAMAWAEDLPQDEPGLPEFKQNCLRRTAGTLGEVDPDAGAAWVARYADGPNASGVVMRFAMAWAKRDAPAAMAWLSKLPQNSHVQMAVQEAYRAWYYADRQAAAEWLRAQGSEPWLDPALSTYAPAVATQEGYPAAIAWAQRMHDPERRDKTIGKIAYAWLGAAPDEADAWLEAADLPESTRQWVARIREVAAQQEKQPRGAGAASAQPADPSPTATAADPSDGSAR